jgi:hypothetical protein
LNSISLISDNDLQQNLFSLVSQTKFTFYEKENVILDSWESRFRDCMNAHFDGMTPVDWGLFYINPSGYVGGVAAGCAWKATFGS